MVANVTASALYSAIYQGKLKAQRINKRWLISPEDLKNYRVNKYNPAFRMSDGVTIVSLQEGRLSTEHVAKILSLELKKLVSVDHVRRLVKLGKIKASKTRSLWVVQKDDLLEFIRERKGQDESQMKMI
mgnify:CR=1 FL=1